MMNAVLVGSLVGAAVVAAVAVALAGFAVLACIVEAVYAIITAICNGRKE